MVEMGYGQLPFLTGCHAVQQVKQYHRIQSA
jgi:hypothetical protein